MGESPIVWEEKKLAENVFNIFVYISISVYCVATTMNDICINFHGIIHITFLFASFFFINFHAEWRITFEWESPTQWIFSPPPQQTQYRIQYICFQKENDSLPTNGWHTMLMSPMSRTHTQMRRTVADAFNENRNLLSDIKSYIWINLKFHSEYYSCRMENYLCLAGWINCWWPSGDVGWLSLE